MNTAVKSLNKLRNRIAFAFLFFAFFTLVDEYVKEGYIFDINDVFNPMITHEKIFLVFLLAGIILGLRRT